MTRYATIVATGRYVPEIEVTNDMLRERFKHIPDFVDKMEATSGIKTRWHAPENWATSDVPCPPPSSRWSAPARSPKRSI
jgi:3-oxoacyl-[acyl-carrier-protein] synthase-3